MTSGGWNQTTAVFERSKYIVNIGGFAHGTVTADKMSADAGDIISLTINPEEGYGLKAGSLKAYKTGDTGTTVTITDNKFSMPAYDVTVEAEFGSTNTDLNHVILYAMPTSSSLWDQRLSEFTPVGDFYTVSIEENYILSYVFVRSTEGPGQTYKASINGGPQEVMTEGGSGGYKTSTSSLSTGYVKINYEIEVTAEDGVTKKIYTVRLHKGTKPTYNVTINAMSNGGVVADPNPATEDDEVTLTVTPDPGYRLKTLAVKKGADSVAHTQIEENKYQFTMPDAEVSVSATFEAIPTHTVTVDPGISNGTVAFSPGSPVYEGAEVSLTITPDEGYQLVADSLTITYGMPATTEIVYGTTFSMPTDDVTITAQFEKIDYTITIDPAIANGTVTVDKTTANYGDEVNLVVTPNGGYRLVEGSLKISYGLNTDNVVGYKFTMPADNVKVSAAFEKKPVPPTPTPEPIEETGDKAAKKTGAGSATATDSTEGEELESSLGGVTLLIDKPTGKQNEKLTATVRGLGTGYEGKTVEFWIHSKPVKLGEGIVKNGEATVTALIPCEVQPGEHTVTARIDGVDIGEPVTVEVIESPDCAIKEVKEEVEEEKSFNSWILIIVAAAAVLLVGAIATKRKQK